MTSSKNYFLICVLLFIFGFKSLAQNQSNSWFRTTLSIEATNELKTDIEFQHRRQNDFESEQLFDKNLMYTFRTWLYFKQNKNITYVVSPFAYFSNYKIIQKQSDAEAKPMNEYRFSCAVELQEAFGSKFFIINRSGVEYRAFEGVIENVVRIRSKLAVRYDCTPKINVSIGDEVLMNASGTDSQHVFDHNRLFTYFSIKSSATTKFDMGYIYISRLTKSSTDLLDENNFFLNFTYTLPHKIHS